MINVYEVVKNCSVVAPVANTLVKPEYIRKHEGTISQAKLVIAQLEIPL